MNKTNIKMPEIDLEALAVASGEAEVKGAPKLDLPILKLNGSKGNFTLLKNGKKIELDNEIEGVILKIRRCCTFYSKTKQMFSTEVNSNNDKMILFEVFTKQNGDRSFNKSDEGTYAELKQRKPDLKFIQVVYFLMDGEIVKLQVKGGGLTNLFEYYKQFNDSHIFQFVTKITTEQKTDPITYYSMVFNKGEAVVDMANVAQKINYLAETLEKIDNFKKQKSEATETAPVAEIDNFEAEPAPDDYEYQG